MHYFVYSNKSNIFVCINTACCPRKIFNCSLRFKINFILLAFPIVFCPSIYTWLRPFYFFKWTLNKTAVSAVQNAAILFAKANSTFSSNPARRLIWPIVLLGFFTPPAVQPYRGVWLYFSRRYILDHVLSVFPVKTFLFSVLWNLYNGL